MLRKICFFLSIFGKAAREILFKEMIAKFSYTCTVHGLFYEHVFPVLILRRLSDGSHVFNFDFWNHLLRFNDLLPHHVSATLWENLILKQKAGLFQFQHGPDHIGAAAVPRAHRNRFACVWPQ